MHSRDSISSAGSIHEGRNQEHPGWSRTSYAPVAQDNHDDAQRRNSADPGVSSVPRTSDGHVGDNARARKTWTSFYLTRSFMLANVLLFLLLIVALEIMNNFSARNHGLATAAQRDHYLWTYGPTLILTIVAAFWSQYEYRAKQMMPWIQMHEHEAPANRSLLLDYISASAPASLFCAARDRHTSVAVGILGTLLLRALIVASTGLLRLEDQTLATTASLALQTQFNFSKIDLSLKLRDASSTVWAHQYYNLSYPAWTTSNSTSNFAAQAFSVPPQLNSSTISADVEVFAADLQHCEPVQWAYTDPELPYGWDYRSVTLPPAYLLNIWSNGCFMHNTTFGTSHTRGNWALDIDNIECSNTTDGQTPQRFLVFLALGTDEDATLPNPLTEQRKSNQGPYLKNLTGIICTPRYSLSRRGVTTFNRNLEQEWPIAVSSRVTEELPMNASVNVMNYRFAQSLRGSAIPASGTVWSALLNETMPQSNITDFSNLDVLSEASQKTFSEVAVQWENINMAPVDGNTAGSVEFTEKRLVVEPISLRLMEAILVMLGVAAMSNCFRRNARVVPRDPARLLTHGILLSQSPGLEKLLHGAGSASEKSLRQRLTGVNFTTGKKSATGPFRITVSGDIESSEDNLPHPPESAWWRPLASSWIFRTVALATTVALVITGEALRQVSSKRRGLADVDNESAWRYAWLYGPAVIMTVTAIAFKELSSVATLLHPFQQLSKPTTDSKTLSDNPADKLPLIAAVRAAVRGQIPLALTIAAALMSSVLTIAASGLYTTEQVPLTEQIAVDALDWFQIKNKTAAVTDGNSTSVAKMVQYYNMSSPQWTYDELAFPRIEATNVSNGYTRLSTRIPAVRARMNCTSQYFDNPGGPEVSVEMPQRCLGAALEGKAKNISLEPSWEFEETVEYFAGSALATATGGSSATAGLSAILDVCQDGRAPAGIAHQWWLVGRNVANETTELTVLHCVPYIETVDVDVAFSLPDYAVDETDPPAPDEATAAFLGDAYTAVAITWTKPNVMVQNNVDNPVMQAAVFAKGGVPLAQLSGEENIPRLVQRVEHAYRQIIAQQLHYDYRTSATASSAASGGSSGDGSVSSRDASTSPPGGTSFRGTATNGTRLRVVQNGIATRILEGILLAMALCVAVAFVLEPKTRILPKNPASVASSMSLLAGSRMMQRFPDDAETVREEELLRKVVPEGFRVRLGWWDDGGEGRRFGVDITDEVEEASGEKVVR